MVTFLILLFAVIAIVCIAVFFVGTGGAAIFLIFGDVIVAGFIVCWIIRAILRRK